MTSARELCVLALALALPLAAFYLAKPRPASSTAEHTRPETPTSMSSDAPATQPFTLEQLHKYDGSHADAPIYVSIKGTVFDVSSKRDVYGPGGSYAVFSGKDASRGLGMSSLKAEDAVADWSTLDAAQRKVLDDWHAFFLKRYPIVGTVTDMPDTVDSKL
ncbi:hypothetical protein BOTBODRAFT_109330 [Botryobasidium botryosum FD-172 SS1]|uniref:Cytochrome b5 heme-binding domain-containing protein n=1 Tax=Botryobasidium botryosum (strain FD-172 SS1) TaxID=930990 RepID=A0A067MTE8_BOTB1|nr:hypothetical protein BOTBODRAFT_109330 [Botryobasidium botryosum FD-172 SS1]